MSGEQLAAADVAARLGISAESWRSYVSTGYGPPPDGRLGRTPWWKPETVDAWNASRPGQGAGGGRPRKRPT